MRKRKKNIYPSRTRRQGGRFEVLPEEELEEGKQGVMVAAQNPLLSYRRGSRIWRMGLGLGWLSRHCRLKPSSSPLPAPLRAPPLVLSWALSRTMLLPPFPLLPLRLISIPQLWLLSSKPRFFFRFVSFN